MIAVRGTAPPRTDAWAWCLTSPDGSGFERIDFTDIGGLSPLNLKADDVSFGETLFTVQVRESAVDAGG